MRGYLYVSTICFSLLCLCMAGCAFAGEHTITPTIEPSATKSIPLLSPFTTEATHTSPFRSTPTSTIRPTSTLTLQPTLTSTPTPFQIVLPAITMSPQEVEAGLLELLRTNGNCTGKCIGGIYPDEMTAQDAVNTMAQWGMVRISENWQGKTSMCLAPNTLYEQVGVHLCIGTWTQKLETIDQVSFSVMGHPDYKPLGEEVWLANRDAWRGISLDGILRAYGIPSFVGYFFQTADERLSSLKGRTIIYNMDMQYEQINLDVRIGALAFYDGQNLYLCPSNDPRNLGMTINPERPLKKLQEFSPVSWQALTSSDLNAFYQVFTSDPDACVTTTLKQVQSLQADFH